MANIQDVSVGWKKETTFGTAVTVDRWMEFLDESLDFSREIKQGAGLRVGNGGVARANRRSSPTSSGSGDITLELFSKGMGTLLELAMGTSVSTVVSGSTYQQNHTLIDGLLPSATIQKGLVDAAGTVHPYTFNGATCTGFEINVPNADVATLKTSWDIRQVVTATAYAAPSYASGGVRFDWGMASVGYGGTLTTPTTTALATGTTALTNVRSISIAVDNGLAGDRYNMGNSGLKAKQVPGVRAITGSIEVEYTDDVLRDAFLNDTVNPLTLTLTSAEALSTGTSQFQVTLPAVYLDSALPKVNGGNLITTTYTFTALDNLTASDPMWCSIRTSDSAL